MKYFEVNVVWEDVQGDKLKKVKERFLVDAKTVTESEARVIAYYEKEYPMVHMDVTSSKESGITHVIES